MIVGILFWKRAIGVGQKTERNKKKEQLKKKMQKGVFLQFFFL
jgi:hypothetical protein